jgi:hypothetical protein
MAAVILGLSKRVREDLLNLRVMLKYTKQGINGSSAEWGRVAANLTAGVVALSVEDGERAARSAEAAPTTGPYRQEPSLVSDRTA